MAEPTNTPAPPEGEATQAAPVPAPTTQTNGGSGDRDLSPIALRAPSKYDGTSKTAPTTSTTSERWVPPSNKWLWRTWAVTHSSLSMWRSAQNVRITYSPRDSNSPLSAGDSPASTVNDNLVEYEKANGSGGVKTVSGVEKPDPNVYGAWNWRGKGLLMIASSHWELLGWGERPCADAEDGVERWVVTWFAPTLFTEEGLDIYCDRREGLSEKTAADIMEALKKLDKAPKLVEMTEKKMREVAINLPWKERK
ncbi:hypothetical protein F5Y16DRAFT_166102 [Xylariaceae sp. FL0255]|nr:hypothetical protein F5Y16DRAFT_166102 [Xylariaceae sp. FL0255]